jgi:hypothetical protein
MSHKSKNGDIKVKTKGKERVMRVYKVVAWKEGEICASHKKKNKGESMY